MCTFSSEFLRALMHPMNLYPIVMKFVINFIRKMTVLVSFCFTITL